MKSILLVIMFTAVYLLGAWSHESDIQRACKESGRSRHAAWQGELICSPMIKDVLNGGNK